MSNLVRVAVGTILCWGSVLTGLGAWYVDYQRRCERGPLDRSRARAPRPKGRKGTYLLGKGQVDPVLRSWTTK